MVERLQFIIKKPEPATKNTRSLLKRDRLRNTGGGGGGIIL